MHEKKQIRWGIILSYLHMAIGVAVTFVYTPFIIRVLGKSDYGLYNSVSSVVASLSVLSLGFGSSYVRFYSRYKAQDDSSHIARLNGMFMIVFCVIGLAALSCGFYLTGNLRLVFSEGLKPFEFDTAKKLMIMLTVNLAVSFPTSVFVSIITANQQFIFQKLILILKQLFSPMISIPLLLGGSGSVGLVVSVVAGNLLMDAANILFCFRKLKIKFEFSGFDKSVIKEIAVFSSFIAINMIVDQINLNMDKMLLGRFCGTEAVAVYSVGFTLYHYYSTFSTSIFNVYTPKVHRIWNNAAISENERNAQLSGLMARVGRLQFAILLLLLSGIVFVGKQFINIWAGEGFDNAYYVVVMLGASAIFPLSQNIGIEIQRAKNMHKFRSFAYLIMAVVNLAVSVALCPEYGELGCAAGTAFSFIAANTVTMNIYYYKAMKIRVGVYWRSVAKILLAATPAFVVGIFVAKFVDLDSIVGILLGAALYGSAYSACMFVFGLDRAEKAAVTGRIIHK